MKRITLMPVGIASAIVATTLMLLGNIGSASASPVSGFFADDVVFLFDPGAVEGPPSSVLGPPDGQFVDLDTGGVTLRFSEVPSAFDYTITVPEDADVIISHIFNVSFTFDIAFGYGSPSDVNGDGVADSVDGIASLLGVVEVALPPWGTLSTDILFYDLDSDPAFHGFTNDFFLTIDDRGDFDLDAIQLVTHCSEFPGGGATGGCFPGPGPFPGKGVPEPTTLLLLALGLTGLGFAKRRLH